MFMVFMMFVILFVVMISPQKGSLQFKDMLMYPLWLAVYLVTVGDWVFYKIRKKEVKASKESSWYYVSFIATVATYPLLNIIVDSILALIGYQVSVEEVFASLLEGQPLLILLDIAGYIFFALGSSLVFGSKLYLRSMWSPLIAEIKSNHKLVDNGVYRLVRHPMYGGAVWMCVGQGLLLHNPLVVSYDLLVVLPLWYRCAKLEEDVLGKEFGEEYEKYRTKVPMFFPISMKWGSG